MTFEKMCDIIMQTEYITLNILTEGEQNRQKDVTINGMSEIYSKLIFQ